MHIDLQVIRAIISKTGGFTPADVFAGLQELSGLRAKVRRAPTPALRARRRWRLRARPPGPAGPPTFTPDHAPTCPPTHTCGVSTRPSSHQRWQCRVELAKIDVLVVPTAAYAYTLQEIRVRGAGRAHPPRTACQLRLRAGRLRLEAAAAAGPTSPAAPRLHPPNQWQAEEEDPELGAVSWAKNGNLGRCGVHAVVWAARGSCTKGHHAPCTEPAADPAWHCRLLS